MPLSLLAHSFPAALAQLRSIAELERLPAHPTHFAFRDPDRTLPQHPSSVERRVWEALDSQPRQVSELARSGAGLEALRRLADAGLATLAAFTPTDAMHVLDRQQGWNREAAEYGARILATEERNARAARAAVSPQAICERTYEHVVCETGRILLAAALAQDPGLQARGRGWGEFGDRLIEDTVAGRRFSSLLQTTLGLARPLVAIGAPVGAYYPEVARRLGASLSIPPHAAVCNAVGAVAGVVSQTVEILVNQPAFKVFRVHDPAGSRDYQDPEPALEHAQRISRELALAAARRAGAADPHVETSVTEKLAQVGPGADYLAEAVARSTATGRPLAGHADALHIG
jgi:N-methylhydantoinase A/oxoprolinase/acetone carboxylase beta subunit